jgi:hypothetical protein
MIHTPPKKSLSVRCRLLNWLQKQTTHRSYNTIMLTLIATKFFHVDNIHIENTINIT